MYKINPIKMKIWILSFMIFSFTGIIFPQETEGGSTFFNNSENQRTLFAPKSAAQAELSSLKAETFKKEESCDELRSPDFESYAKCRLNKTPFRRLPENAEKPEKEKSSPDIKSGFRLKSALAQTGLMLGVQHGFRLLQKKTRRELGGPFFRDWGRSVKNLRGWRDSDNVFTNYVAHPLQGGVTGRIFLTNSPQERTLEFGKSSRYWKSRFNAMLWSAFWSTQFELGPVSEATIGNVGLRKKNGVSTMGYVDLVMTPTAGTGIIIGEDVIEKYVLNKMLRKNGGRASVKIKLLRSFLTPTMSLNNLLRGNVPWKRDQPIFQAGK